MGVCPLRRHAWVTQLVRRVGQASLRQGACERRSATPLCGGDRPVHVHRARRADDQHAQIRDEDAGGAVGADAFDRAAHHLVRAHRRVWALVLLLRGGGRFNACAEAFVQQRGELVPLPSDAGLCAAARLCWAQHHARRGPKNGPKTDPNIGPILDYWLIFFKHFFCNFMFPFPKNFFFIHTL